MRCASITPKILYGNLQEEQKLFDFFSEPSEFGLCLRGP